MILPWAVQKMAEPIEMLFGFWTQMGQIKQLRCGLTWNYFDHLLYYMYILLHFSQVQRTVCANWTCENAPGLVCMWHNNSVTREWDVEERRSYVLETLSVIGLTLWWEACYYMFTHAISICSAGAELMHVGCFCYHSNIHLFVTVLYF